MKELTINALCSHGGYSIGHFNEFGERKYSKAQSGWRIFKKQFEKAAAKVNFGSEIYLSVSIYHATILFSF